MYYTVCTTTYTEPDRESTPEPGVLYSDYYIVATTAFSQFWAQMLISPIQGVNIGFFLAF